MNQYQNRHIPYRTPSSLTSQVPYLSQYGINQNEERWGFLPFVGGLALGGLLFNGWGGGRPCCGGGFGGGYPAYPPAYFPQPIMPFQQQQFQQQQFFQPQVFAQPMVPQSTIVESNKFYVS